MSEDKLRPGETFRAFPVPFASPLLEWQNAGEGGPVRGFPQPADVARGYLAGRPGMTLFLIEDAEMHGEPAAVRLCGAFLDDAEDGRVFESPRAAREYAEKATREFLASVGAGDQWGRIRQAFGYDAPFSPDDGSPEVMGCLERIEFPKTGRSENLAAVKLNGEWFVRVTGVERALFERVSETEPFASSAGISAVQYGLARGSHE